ncbi:MAG: RagB/SusD family nutrient uptake outer membrane protein [Bacteroidaceae bacterium]|nr:RagB/SusD family nutrient uptake outer membrane protein [Bacteroidaceae bacterium]
MKIKNLILSGVAALSVFTSCNDSFLEREPVGTLGESNAFLTYDNFKAYMYNCYGMFTDARIYTNFSGGSYYWGGQYSSDFYAGIMTNREDSKNPYAYGTKTVTTSSSNWNFSYPRTINIMLSHLDSSNLTETEKAHWRSVGYFFHAYWYMELVAKYGDVPWINQPLTDESPEAYGPRTPRAEVVDSIISRLEYAAANIGDTSRDGDNCVTADAVKVLLSRFLLREGTWAKYHGLDEPWQNYLEKCLTVSQELMNAYPTLHKGNGINKYPGAGYDEIMTSEDLSNVPGVIMYKQYLDPLVRHRFSDLIHVEAHRCDAPQHTVDMFLMKNGKPIDNANSGFQGGEGKDLYDYFADRDPRLYINFCPPAVTKIGNYADPDNETTFKKWTFYKAGDTYKGQFEVTPEYEEKFRRYIDYLGPNVFCDNGTGDESIGSKRLPGHNWGGTMSSSSPNISHWSQTENYMRCWTGYYFWKHFTMWEVGSNDYYQTSDKPIFTIEEILLNYAEAAKELNKFNQTVADKTINLLRDRVGVAKMVVSEIDANFDPNRDKGTAAWTRGYDSKTNYEVDPVLWEIRRERMVELMGQGFSFYDVKRWHKAPYYTNRQPCGAWVTAANLPYGTGKFSGQFVNYNEIKQTGKAMAQNNSTGSGWIYTYESPLAVGTGWNDIFYLEMVPQDQINLNPELKQNDGYNELFGLN